jgi:hypothetical protein
LAVEDGEAKIAQFKEENPFWANSPYESLNEMWIFPDILRVLGGLCLLGSIAYKFCKAIELDCSTFEGDGGPFECRNCEKKGNLYVEVFVEKKKFM